MKKLFLLILPAFLLASGCGNKTGKETGTEEKVTSDTGQKATPAAEKKLLSLDNETTLLLKDLEENGDYVNSQNFPSLIKASIVNEELGKKNLVIDIRPADLYSKGHIKGAVNKIFSDLPEYFEAGIKPFEYDRIIMVDNDGSVSSYATSLLRLMGYGNVYAMRWGMSAWNKECADQAWLKNVSGKYESKLETAAHEKEPGSTMPLLKTGLATGPDIASARFKKLFQDGTDKVTITADEVFSDPSKYYIINLERKDKYEDGHIPGAIRYKPEETLGFPDEMTSIPPDKPVVVYCGTAHNSSFATAFLRLFGYDAKTLRYGNNSFMHDKMVSQKAALSWLPFTSAEVNNFELVK
ncbi:MAG TPA: rhodanese-like domain-containing protein [Bacteroidales bacterium]|jgi:rhodanese-related sulfurtransferase|nr:rhodanese-like domain-containing protein [Bacteroidales bacterium]